MIVHSPLGIPHGGPEVCGRCRVHHTHENPCEAKDDGR